ncbi:MAG: SelB C-terminal domain-containing protein, partial [Actinobacteria bacterium]|nr:SelB C-terminal domain-containing protein [Actinomycetota bacterium]
ARVEEAERLVRDLDAAGLRAVKIEDDELARFLEARGELVRLGREHAISVQSFAIAKEALLSECASAAEITLARFRDLLDVGRRDAQLLLERFDQDGITRRVGDRRVLRRSSAQSA